MSGNDAWVLSATMNALIWCESCTIERSAMINEVNTSTFSWPKMANKAVKTEKSSNCSKSPSALKTKQIGSV